MGYRLKLLQRDRALAIGVDLIEWTYDPLQAANAHLNFVKLGVVVDEYLENVYGESGSPLHQGNPTDRFVAEWFIRERSVSGTELGAKSAPPSSVAPTTPSPSTGRSGRANGSSRSTSTCRPKLDGSRSRSRWASPTCSRARRSARWPGVSARARFFTTYLARGYRVVDFVLNRGARKGTYVMERHASVPRRSA